MRIYRWPLILLWTEGVPSFWAIPIWSNFSERSLMWPEDSSCLFFVRRLVNFTYIWKLPSSLQFFFNFVESCHIFIIFIIFNFHILPEFPYKFSLQFSCRIALPGHWHFPFGLPRDAADTSAATPRVFLKKTDWFGWTSRKLCRAGSHQTKSVYIYYYIRYLQHRPHICSITYKFINVFKCMYVYIYIYTYTYIYTITNCKYKSIFL